MHIETPGERSSELVAALVDVWERSVRATHDFLAEADIEMCIRDRPKELSSV